MHISLILIIKYCYYNFNNDNYESGFLYAIKELSGVGLSDWASNKVNALKGNGQGVKEFRRSHYL